MVVFSGGSVVDESRTVDVVTGASVVDVVVVEEDVAAGAVVGVSVEETPPALVVDVVGAPAATGVSTTRSRIPATAADAMRTDSAVAASHATPIPTYFLISSSMHRTNTPWVN